MDELRAQGVGDIFRTHEAQFMDWFLGQVSVIDKEFKLYYVFVYNDLLIYSCKFKYYILKTHVHRSINCIHWHVGLIHE